MTERPHSERTIGNSNTDVMSRASGTVLKTAAALTPEWVKKHPEVVDLYRDTTLTRDSIAQIIAPDIASTFPSAARAAIGNVLGELVSKEERAQMTTERRRKTASENLRGDMTDEEFRESQRQRARGKRREDIDWSEGVRKKGLTPWSDHEKSYALYLRTQPDYQYKDGPYSGLPIRSKIVEALNTVFHEGMGVRDINSLRGFLNQPKKK